MTDKGELARARMDARANEVDEWVEWVKGMHPKFTRDEALEFMRNLHKEMLDEALNLMTLEQKRFYYKEEREHKEQRHNDMVCILMTDRPDIARATGYREE